MTYTPQNPDDFAPPFAPNNGVLGGVWDNHNEVRDAYRQHLGTCVHPDRTVDGVPLLWLFKQRGNAGLADVEVIARIVISGGGTYDVGLKDGDASVTDSASITGAGAHTVTLTVTPDAADDTFELSLVRTSGGGHADLLSWVAYSEGPSTPAAIVGWTNAPASNPWLSSGEAVAVEHMERLLDGPGAILRDRPHCLFSHFVSDAALAAVKGVPDFELWGRQAGSSDAQQVQQCGYGGIIVDDLRPRTLYVEALVEADDVATASAQIRIGGWIWDPTPGVWDSTTVVLEPGLHDVYASVASDDGDAVLFRSLQIWRL
jgi:hypothetical protein